MTVVNCNICYKLYSDAGFVIRLCDQQIFVLEKCILFVLCRRTAAVAAAVAVIRSIRLDNIIAKISRSEG